MPDREKVIRLIEEEISVCESVDQCYRTIDLPALRDILAMLKEQDNEIYALRVELASANELAEGYAELLKEQEAVEPKPVHNSFRWFACGKCDCSITKEDRFCPRCGQAVKWE